MALDAITAAACKAVNAPVSLITVLSATHQHFRSVTGLPEPWRSRRCTPLSMSFCRHVVMNAAPLQVDYAPDHPQLHDHPAVEALNIVAYLGGPVLDAERRAVGALCAIDVALRRWTAKDRAALGALAHRIREQGLLDPMLAPEA